MQGNLTPPITSSFGLQCTLKLKYDYLYVRSNIYLWPPATNAALSYNANVHENCACDAMEDPWLDKRQCVQNSGQRGPKTILAMIDLFSNIANINVSSRSFVRQHLRTRPFQVYCGRYEGGDQDYNNDHKFEKMNAMLNAGPPELFMMFLQLCESRRLCFFALIDCLRFIFTPVNGAKSRGSTWVSQSAPQVAGSTTP